MAFVALPPLPTRPPRPARPRFLSPRMRASPLAEPPPSDRPLPPRRPRPVAAPRRAPPPPHAAAGLLNLAADARWLFSSPPSYCSVDSDLRTLVHTLQQKVFYLGPVTRNKVVRAVELARSTLAPGPHDVRRFSRNVVVALIVADLQMDCDTVCAAVLSGLVGRPGCTRAQVDREVGPDVLRILHFHRQVVQSVRHCMDPAFTEMSFSNLRELVLVGAMDEHRAISLELARAVLQIRTLDALTDEEEKRNVARRTMYLYAPLANQLGIWFVQGELEELAFMYLQPESFEMVRQLVGERRRECESTLQRSKGSLERELSTTPEVRSLVRKVEIKGRVKGMYSVYRKMRRSGKKVHEIYDLLALRVVVQPKRADEGAEEAACYAVADVIREQFETFESRAKDYIAAPKRNGYRSLHLTVVPRGGSTPLEIQVRTERMDHVAEYGAAAHWIYKEESREEDEWEETCELMQGGLVCEDKSKTGVKGVKHKKMGGSGTNDKDDSDGGADGGMYSTTATGVQGQEKMVESFKIKQSGAVVVVKQGVGGDELDKLDKLRSGLRARGARPSGGEIQEQLRKGYVTWLASAIRTSRVIVATAGQLYGLAVGSTLLDLARGLGVASLGAIAVVNGSVAPLTQRLEMNDIVRFISALPEA